MPGTIDETIALIENAGGSAFGLTADLEDAVARDGLVDAVLDRTGRIDILVNNAGFADYAPIDEMLLETFDRTVEHYLRTPFVLTKAVVPHMRKRAAGWIVNIARSHRLPHATLSRVQQDRRRRDLRCVQGRAASLHESDRRRQVAGRQRRRELRWSVDSSPHTWCSTADSRWLSD